MNNSTKRYAASASPAERAQPGESIMTKQDGKDVPELGYLPSCIGQIGGCKVNHCHYGKRCDYNSNYPGKRK